MSVVVRNRKSGPTVFTDSAKNVVIEWQGFGHPQGEDVQQVPDEVAQSPAFLRTVRKGVLEIVDAGELDLASLAAPAVSGARTTPEEAAAAFSAQFTSAQEADAAADAAALASIEAAADNDIEVVKCLISGQDIAVKVSDRHRRPPLAEEFRDREHEFIPQPTGEMESDGTPVVNWVRASAGLSSEPAPSQSI